jgi:hypothetical protein
VLRSSQAVVPTLNHAMSYSCSAFGVSSEPAMLFMKHSDVPLSAFTNAPSTREASPPNCAFEAKKRALRSVSLRI